MHGDSKRPRRAVEVLHRAQLVGQHDEPEILGHRRLDLVTPASELGGVERDSFDTTAGGVAAFVIRVVVAPAGTADEPNALRHREGNKVGARAVETSPRRRRGAGAVVPGGVGKVW